MNSKRIDISVGSTLSFFSVIIFLYSNEYKVGNIIQYGPNFFPQLLSVIMLFLSLMLIVNAVKGKSQTDLESIDKVGFIRSAITLGIAVAYLVIMQFLGFFISTVLFLYVLMTFIGHKGKLVRIISCLGVTIIVYGIFYLFLKVPLPGGIFNIL